LFGQDYYKIEATNGRVAMLADMASFGFDHTFSSLHPDTRSINPDDSFSVNIVETIK